MSDIERLRDMLVLIGQGLNILGLQEYPAQKSFTFALDENSIVDIEYDSGRRIIVLSARLGVPPPSNVERVQRLALIYGSQLYANGGCHVGLDQKTGDLVLHAQHATDSVDADRLGLLLLNFIEKTRAWQKIVATPDDKGSDVASEVAGDFVIRL